MGLVTEVDDDAAPTVLIVDNNPMSSMRLSNLFKTRNFSVALCEDGDQAVDEYIRLDPELVVLSLDIPSLDVTYSCTHRSSYFLYLARRRATP